jgi:hypothetical protein
MIRVISILLKIERGAMSLRVGAGEGGWSHMAGHWKARNWHRQCHPFDIAAFLCCKYNPVHATKDYDVA